MAGPRRKLPFGTGRGLAAPHAFSIRPWDGYYNSVAEVDRTCRYRIMASADLLSGYNPALQDLPSWDVLKRLVVGLPADPPAPAPEVVTQEVTTDWTGHHNFISGSTLTRTVRGTA